MTTYTGTLTGDTEATVNGVTYDVSVSDVDTETVTFKKNGNFTGKDVQTVTVTITDLSTGKTYISTEYHDNTVSGNADAPIVVKETIGGQPTTITVTFMDDNLQIGIEGKANISYGGYSGVFTISGEMTTPLPTFAEQNSSRATVFFASEGGSKIEELTSGSISWRTNNPGDIQWTGQKDAIGFYQYKVDGSILKDCIFADYNSGVQAAVKLLEGSQYAGSNLSVDQALQQWTGLPADSANLAHYDAAVAKALGLPGSTLLSTLTDAQLETVVIKGIQVADGWHSGEIIMS